MNRIKPISFYYYNKMNIILVSVGTFQEYILVNIKQLLRLHHKPESIYVITDNAFFGSFLEYSGINLISTESLADTYIDGYNQNAFLEHEWFRDGFWRLTSARFFYIRALMDRNNIRNVIHLENDVPIYYNCNTLSGLLDETKMYMPFDSYNRNIASIVYIPDSIILGRVLDQYNIQLNDMENFAIIRKQSPELIDGFPIFKDIESLTDEERYVCRNFDKFNIIFDGAAIGQYLGGIDPRNTPGDTTGFINETCVIKYNEYKIYWVTGDDTISRPFIEIDGIEVPIFNLHIHSKNLERFVY